MRGRGGCFRSHRANWVLAAEVNPAYVMYFGVVVVGLVGAAIARLRARGMALVLVGTAIAQMFVPFIALVFWKTNVAPGAAVPVVGLNAVFTVLFAISALLFRRAARTDKLLKANLSPSGVSA
jgi:lipopolysaccharide export LptBFGC system permease protein LptF